MVTERWSACSQWPRQRIYVHLLYDSWWLLLSKSFLGSTIHHEETGTAFGTYHLDLYDSYTHIMIFHFGCLLRMARIRERKTRHINQIKCIKEGTDRLLVKDDEIKSRWREYFDKLFNGENEGTTFELDDSFDDTNRRFVRRFQETDIREALKRMKGSKAMGPDGIPIEVWRCLGDRAIVWLTKLFNLIFRSNMMPEEWRRNILVPIFKK